VEKGRWYRGGKLYFTRDITLPGGDVIKAGDEAVYLGDNRCKLISGGAKDWVVVLTITAPVEWLGGTVINTSKIPKVSNKSKSKGNQARGKSPRSSSPRVRTSR
jgi:hypothetical protein